jgi:hypothetical protein
MERLLQNLNREECGRLQRRLGGAFIFIIFIPLLPLDAQTR